MMSLTSQSPIETLRSRYDQLEDTCPWCENKYIEKSWQVMHMDAEIRFKHICSTCGAERQQVVSLSSPNTD